MYKEYTSHDELVALVTSACEHACKSIKYASLDSVLSVVACLRWYWWWGTGPGLDIRVL
jgi:hypothetical protein